MLNTLYRICISFDFVMRVYHIYTLHTQTISRERKRGKEREREKERVNIAHIEKAISTDIGKRFYYAFRCAHQF